MGTNYYFCSKEPLDLELDVDYNAYHIGKRSAGWQFTFRGHQDVESMRDWITLFETTPGHVLNEYGEEFDVMTFMQDIVKPTKGRRIMDLTDDPPRWIPPSLRDADEIDDDGWHIVNREFC